MLNATDLVKPPTDSLYKFLTVLSFVGAAFCFYILNNTRIEAESAKRDFQRHEDERGEEVSEATGRVAPSLQPALESGLFPPPDLDMINADDEERMRWMKFVNDYLNYLDRNRYPPSRKEMVDYFGRQDVKDYFQQEEEMSPREYEQYAKDMTFPKFKALLAQGQGFYQKQYRVVLRHKNAIRELWNSLDSNRVFYDWTLWKMRILGAIAVISCMLWYSRAQRHQDAILTAERAAAESNTVAENNCRDSARSPGQE